MHGGDPRESFIAVVAPLGSLLVVSLRGGDVSLDARERALAGLTRGHRDGAFVFATCHRVELYALAEARACNRSGLAELGFAEVPAGMRALRGSEAVRHLFRVAAGLDSVIPGEGQLLGQLRRARQAAAGVAFLDAFVQRALNVARVIRARTGLGAGAGSLGSLAVDEALRHLVRPESATGLVVGAGEMGALAARAMARRVRSLLIANRGEGRALEVARAAGAVAFPLAQIDEALARADVVISAADTRGVIFDGRRLERRIASGPLVLVDLAVPRSITAEARALPGLVYQTADDLTDTGAPPADVVAEAERLCARAAERFAAECRQRTAVPVIQGMRAHADALRRRQLARAMAKLGHLSARDREVVRALAWSLTNALMRAPTLALRGAPQRANAARALFRLEEP